jgi:hypothetical protein
MILYPSSLILAAPVSLKNPRIGYQTWLRDLAVAAITVSSETAAGPRDAPLRPDTYEFWEPESLPAWWLADLGQVRDVDYVGILGSIGSNGAALELRHSLDTEFEDYITLPDRDGNYLSSPDSVAASVTGDIDIRARVRMDNIVLPTFWLPLNDLGDGEVNLVPRIAGGSATPTYTRASVQWTKLATGLWKEKSSGTGCSYHFGLNTEVGQYCGYVPVGANTARITTNVRDLTSNWTATNVTPAATQVGIDGVTNSCSSLTATSNAGTFLRAVTLASGARIFQPFVKRLTGTGTVEITLNGGTNWTDITSLINSSTFTQVSVTATLANPSVGFRLGTSGDAVAVDMADLCDGNFATPPLAGANRAANVLTYAFAGNADATQGTCLATLGTFWTTAPSVVYAVNTGTTTGRLLYNAAGDSQRISIQDGTTPVTKAALTDMNTGARKRGSSYGVAGMAITGDGAAPSTNVFDGDMANTNIAIGCRSDGIQQWDGTIKDVMIFAEQDAAAELQRLTRSVPYPIVAKWVESGNQRSYALAIDPRGFMRLFVSVDGTSATIREYQSVPFTLTESEKFDARVTLDINNGAGLSVATFYTSEDGGETWDQVGDPVAQTSIAGIFDSTAAIEVGAYDGGKAGIDGRVFEAKVLNGIGGSVAWQFDAEDAASESVTTITSEQTTEVWTINSSGIPAPEIVLHAFSTPLAPADDAPIMLLNSTIPLRYLRLGLTGAGDAPRISNIYAGVALAMERPIRGGGFVPLQMARSTRLRSTMSRTGQILGQDFRRHGIEAQVNFQLLDSAWVRNYLDPFIKSARQYPYFLAWRPLTHPLEVAFGVTEKDIRPSMQGLGEMMQVAFEISGVGNE